MGIGGGRTHQAARGWGGVGEGGDKTPEQAKKRELILEDISTGKVDRLLCRAKSMTCGVGARSGPAAARADNGGDDVLP